LTWTGSKDKEAGHRIRSVEAGLFNKYIAAYNLISIRQYAMKAQPARVRRLRGFFFSGAPMDDAGICMPGNSKRKRRLLHHRRDGGANETMWRIGMEKDRLGLSISGLDDDGYCPYRMGWAR
jgi:hypothetical protein